MGRTGCAACPGPSGLRGGPSGGTSHCWWVQGAGPSGYQEGWMLLETLLPCFAAEEKKNQPLPSPAERVLRRLVTELAPTPSRCHAASAGTHIAGPEPTLPAGALALPGQGGCTLQWPVSLGARSKAPRLPRNSLPSLGGMEPPTPGEGRRAPDLGGCWKRGGEGRGTTEGEHIQGDPLF